MTPPSRTGDGDPVETARRIKARALEGWTLERFLNLDEDTFGTLFAGSPIRRARRAGFLRNVCVALGNRGEPAAAAGTIRRALGQAAVADADHDVRAEALAALERGTAA